MHFEAVNSLLKREGFPLLEGSDSRLTMLHKCAPLEDFLSRKLLIYFYAESSHEEEILAVEHGIVESFMGAQKHFLALETIQEEL